METTMDLLPSIQQLDFDCLSCSLCACWTIVNKSPFLKKIIVKLKGNESGQTKKVAPHSSVVMPDNPNCRFWDAETHIEIFPQRQVIINKDGFYE